MNESSPNLAGGWHVSTGLIDKELHRWGFCLVVVLALHVGVFVSFELWKAETDQYALVSGAMMIDLPPLPGPAGRGVGGESVTDHRSSPAPMTTDIRVHTHLHPLVKLKSRIEHLLNPQSKHPPPMAVSSAQRVSSTMVAPEGAASTSEIGKARSGGLGDGARPSSGCCGGDGGSASAGVGQGGPLTWEGLLLVQLEQHKRYPATAIEHGEEGVAYLRFAMNRAGKVLAFSLEKSSGFPDLDQETLDLIQRSQPLPPPPPTVKGSVIDLVVPVQFQLQQEE